MTTVKYKLIVAYDGMDYSGWQMQSSGVGVQEKVQHALKAIYGLDVCLHGSSRTDTGVHALGMAAHFELPAESDRFSARRLPLALNSHLPESIRITDAERADESFHARFDAKGKQYRYLIWNNRAMNPLLRRNAWHVSIHADIPPMQAAAKHLLGKKDFRSFATAHTYEIENTVRTLSRCDVRKAGSLITIIIEGDGFLYKMCRAIAGTLIQVGQGKIRVGDMDRILADQNRSSAGINAPAHGLTLWKVTF